MLRIAIIVGEPSGDLLAASLMAGLKKQLPNVCFYGVGGQNMKEQGFHSWYNMEQYTFMGLDKILIRFVQLKFLQKTIISRLRLDKPDLFIGVDSSSFNLKIAYTLKKDGIKTIQYVSPKVWAWRQDRVYKIKESVDYVLTLFPFEKDFLNRFHIQASFVGHPFADEIPLIQDKNDKRNKYGYRKKDQMIVVMPGSRSSDLKHMAPLFIETMIILQKNIPQVKFVVPLLSTKLKQQFEEQLKGNPHHLNLKIIVGKTRDILSIADLVLIKSGTGTLETMLMKKPMVVAYKTGYFTYCYYRTFIAIPFISLPNILAQKDLVPEFIQDDAQPELLANACLELIKQKEEEKVTLLYEFQKLHIELKKNNQALIVEEIMNILT